MHWFALCKKKSESLGIPFSYHQTNCERGKCGTAKTLYIDEMGNVSPCVYLNKPTQLTMNGETITTEPIIWGNVFKEDAIKIWRKKECVDFRRKLWLGQAEECQKCGMMWKVIC